MRQSLGLRVFSTGLALVSGLLASTTFLTAQVKFQAADVVSGQVEYDYNTKDDLGYINSKSTGHNYLQSTSAVENIVRDTEPPSPCFIPKTGATGPSSTCSITWHFQMPAGYTISSLSVGYRLTTFASANPLNSVQLLISSDGSTYSSFASLQAKAGPTPGVMNNDMQMFGQRAKDLTKYVAGKSEYYIKGEIVMGAQGEAFPNQLQLFRADDPGASGATFTNTLSLRAASAKNLTDRNRNLVSNQN